MARIAKQRDAIKNHLKRGLSLTPLEALRLYGCFRLAAVVYTLKYDYGMNIKTEMVSNPHTGKKFARYSLSQTIKIE